MNGEHANTIAQEARRIVTNNNSLAHTGLIELFETLNDIAASVFAAHNLEPILPKDVVKRIVFRENGFETLRDITHQVDANKIIESEDPGFWDAHGPTENRIGLFGRQAHAKRRV